MAVKHLNPLNTKTTDKPSSQPQVWKPSSAQAAEALRKVLVPYDPISLGEMESVALLRRLDTKYILHVQQLVKALRGLGSSYRVLEIQE